MQPKLLAKITAKLFIKLISHSLIILLLLLCS
ncbi:MAG: hypothetical protein RL497_1804, partial [Pseudomonadota bacterium]